MSESLPRSQRRREQTNALHRQQILDAAEFLFGSRGYALVAMEDVAEHCLFSRRTLYRYFPTKEHLAGELTLQALGELLALFRAVPEGQGLARLSRLGSVLGSFAFERTARYQSLRLRWYVGVPDEAKREILHRIVELNRQLEAVMLAAIEAGLADGSIRSSEAPRTWAVVIMGSAAGLLDSIVAFGPRYSQVYGLEPLVVWNSHLDFIERALAPPSSSASS